MLPAHSPNVMLRVQITHCPNMLRVQVLSPDVILRVQTKACSPNVILRVQTVDNTTDSKCTPGYRENHFG